MVSKFDVCQAQLSVRRFECSGQLTAYDCKVILYRFNITADSQVRRHRADWPLGPQQEARHFGSAAAAGSFVAAAPASPLGFGATVSFPFAGSVVGRIRRCRIDDGSVPTAGSAALHQVRCHQRLQHHRLIHRSCCRGSFGFFGGLQLSF